MKPLDELERQGLESCREHAARRIQGDLLVESTTSGIAWDPIQFRNYFEQSLVIWRRTGTFEVILDSEGRVAGFVDHDKYAGSKGGLLAPGEVDALAAATGLVPAGARRVELKEQRVSEEISVYRARYELPRPRPGHAEVEVELNPKRKEVIAVRPILRRT